jgi:integrase
MATIKLKFRPSSVPETEGTLYYQVIHKRKVKWISTGYHVYPSEWDEKAGEVLIPPNSERKAELEKMQSQINWELKQWDSIIVEMENQHKNVTINELCDAFNKTKTQKTVFMFLQEQVTKKEQMKRQGTAMTYSNAYRRFKEFREGKDLTFDELTPDMMECYEAWLKDRRLKQNSISCYLRTLCTLLYKATDEGMRIDSNLFSHVRLSYVKTTKRAISEKEMRAIAMLQLPEGTSIAFARDVFMFSFYMRGMPFVDIAYLRKKDLKNKMLAYSRKKTNQYLTVEWVKEAQEIIDRYEQINPASPYLLPIIQQDDGTEQKQYHRMLENINYNLKKIGEMTGLKMPLTTYTARHTWASIARDMDIPIPIISEGMGHNSIKTTQVYLNSIDVSKINEANKKIIRKISKKNV